MPRRNPAAFLAGVATMFLLNGLLVRGQKAGDATVQLAEGGRWVDGVGSWVMGELYCFDADGRERWRLPLGQNQGFSQLMLGQTGSLYARDGAGAIRVLRDCSGVAIPGWRTCEGTVVQQYGPEGDKKILPKYGWNMALVPIYPSGTEERFLFGQTFSAPMPAEVKSLRCDFLVVTDDTTSQFSSEFSLRLEADGIATAETPPGTSTIRPTAQFTTPA